MGADSPRTLVAELERHLRALLRDVLCGYLDSDLARVADDMLLETSEPQEMRAPEVAPAPRRVEAAPATTWIDEAQDRLEDPAFWSAPV